VQNPNAIDVSVSYVSASVQPLQCKKYALAGPVLTLSKKVELTWSLEFIFLKFLMILATQSQL